MCQERGTESGRRLVARHNYDDVSYLMSNHNSVITKVCNSVAKLTVNQANYASNKVNYINENWGACSGFFVLCLTVGSLRASFARVGELAVLARQWQYCFQCRGHERASS